MWWKQDKLGQNHYAGFLVSYYATDGDMVTHGQTIKLAFIYMISTVIGVLLSVPVWKMTGLI